MMAWSLHARTLAYSACSILPPAPDGRKERGARPRAGFLGTGAPAVGSHKYSSAASELLDKAYKEDV